MRRSMRACWPRSGSTGRSHKRSAEATSSHRDRLARTEGRTDDRRTLVVVAAVVSVSAGQREPYETASPFVGLYQLTEVHTSNDLVE